MAKSALLIKMIDILRNKPGITIAELSETLGRSERTVYRWLSDLCADLETPAVCRDGGYYLVEKSVSKLIDLSSEELLALRMSLKSSPFGPGSPVKEYAESAWLKIRDAVPNESISAAGELVKKHSIKVTAHSDLDNPGIVKALENAVRNHRRLRVLYRSQNSGATKPYVIDPYAMVFRRHSWYLLAFSQEHDKVIQMKLIRFLSVVDTGLEFEPPSDFSIEEHFSSSWEAWSSEEKVRVRVRFSPKVAQMICESSHHPIEIVRREADGGIVLEAEVAGIKEIAIWIMGYGRDAEVLEPEELREYIIDHIMGSIRNYGLNEENILSEAAY